MKLTRLAILGFFFLLPALSFCQENMTSDQKEIYRTIVLISDSWSQNNLDTLEKYLDRDYVHTDVRGQFLNRSKWLSYVKDRKEKGVVNSSVGFDDVHIEIHGQFAFVTGVNTFSGAAYTGTDNKTQPRKLRFTQILLKEGNVWKRLKFQATYIDDL
jgi:ketosteroid isomerase-like protein